MEVHVHGTKLKYLVERYRTLTETKSRRTATDNAEVTFHLSRELVKALKMKAVQDEMKFSKVAEVGLRQYLGLPKEKEKEKEKPPKKEKGVNKS